LIDKIIEKYSSKLSSSNPTIIISLTTLTIVVSSVPLVYLLILLYGVQYTDAIFVISIAAPFLMVPPTVYIVIKLSKHLNYFQEELKKEVKKNKKRDVLLFEQARFALMGEMIANISHQWKQPLNTINLAVLAARTSDTLEEEEQGKYFDIVEDNVNHLASTIDDFMSFFDKRTHSEMKTLDAVVKEIKSIIFTHISNKDIELDIMIDSSYGNIEIASSISQVVLNLLNNSKDAFEDVTHFKKIKLQFISNEYGLEIECCDNGKGIPSEIADKIFDPYFTTKAKAQGTGIGLYMSKEIVQKMFDGNIGQSSRAYSRSNMQPLDNSGKTCFFIAIPYSSNCILRKDYK
jgi:signal transduction histidine kinase